MSEAVDTCTDIPLAVSKNVDAVVLKSYLAMSRNVDMSHSLIPPFTIGLCYSITRLPSDTDDYFQDLTVKPSKINAPREAHPAVATGTKGLPQLATFQCTQKSLL